MDKISLRIATAALPLQSVMLQAPVYKGLLVPARRWRSSIKAWTLSFRGPTMKPPTQVTRDCYRQLHLAQRDSVVGLKAPRRPGDERESILIANMSACRPRPCNGAH